jgi:hypothetical protein
MEIFPVIFGTRSYTHIVDHNHLFSPRVFLLVMPQDVYPGLIMNCGGGGYLVFSAVLYSNMLAANITDCAVSLSSR